MIEKFYGVCKLIINDALKLYRLWEFQLHIISSSDILIPPLFPKHTIVSNMVPRIAMCVLQTSMLWVTFPILIKHNAVMVGEKRSWTTWSLSIKHITCLAMPLFWEPPRYWTSLLSLVVRSGQAQASTTSSNRWDHPYSAIIVIITHKFVRNLQFL